MKTVHGTSIGWKSRRHCTFMNLLLCMVIFSLTGSSVQGDSCPTSFTRMAGQSTSYGSFMPASNTPTCYFKILMTLRPCCKPSDLGYRVSVVLFCVILLTLRLIGGYNISPLTPQPLRSTTCDTTQLLLTLIGQESARDVGP